MPATLSDPQLLGGSPSQDGFFERKYFVRFRTARAVRLALARLAILSGRSSPEQAQAYLGSAEFPGQIVVVVEPVSGGDAPELNYATFSYLKESTYLFLKNSDRKIELQQYVTPSQQGGSQAFFIFPRKQDEKELVSLQEEEVRFVCRLSPDTKIEQKFKLEKMIYEGALDL